MISEKRQGRNNGRLSLPLLLACLLPMFAHIGVSMAQDQSTATSEPENRPVGAAAQSAESAPLDPAAWGEDHGDEPLPEYVTGDQCLFCHRNDIGPTWDKNLHARTIRFPSELEPALDAAKNDPAASHLVAESQYLLGRIYQVRYLRDGEGYGHMEVAGAQFVPPLVREGQAILDAGSGWDADVFAKSCAGCHATAVEDEPPRFAAFSLDCYSCHGAVTLNHTNDTSLMLLSKKREDPARVIASTCGQCHLRGGHSASTGRPYPDRFVSGNNLFKDFRVDFSDEYLGRLNPDDRHIYRNIRKIVVENKTEITCLTCHEVHAESSDRHKDLPRTQLCLDCHAPEDPLGDVVDYRARSEICQY